MEENPLKENLSAPASWRTRFNDAPIRRKFALVLVISFLAGGVIAISAAAALSLNAGLRNAARDAESFGRVVAYNLTAPLAFNDDKAAREAIDALSTRPEVLGGAVYAGVAAAVAAPAAATAKPVAAYRAAPPAAAAAPGWRTLRTSVPVELNGAVLGHLVIDTDLRPALRQVARELALMLGGGLVAFGLALYLGLRVERAVLAPLEDLTGAIQSTSRDGALSMHVERRGNDEVGVLVDGFNRMMDTIGDSNRALARHRDELEATVATRTADLVRARDAAEAASRAKSQFVANMSHELRTPMNAVLGFVEVLRDSVADAGHKRHASLAHDSGLQLLSIINNILDFSKIEAGKLSLEPAVFQPEVLLDDIAAMFHSQAHKSGLAFTLLIDPALPQLLTGDAARIRQILINLAGNALKFTEQGSIHLSASYRGGELHLSVKDTGIGIAPEARDQVFAAFAQADESMTRRYGGTGLGLAIVKQLTSLMGGRIELQSALGEGSEFSVSLPAAVPDADGASAGGLPAWTSPAGSSPALSLPARSLSAWCAPAGTFVVIAAATEQTRNALAARLSRLGCAHAATGDVAALSALLAAHSVAAHSAGHCQVWVDGLSPDAVRLAAPGIPLVVFTDLPLSRPLLVNVADEPKPANRAALQRLLEHPGEAAAATSAPVPVAAAPASAREGTPVVRRVLLVEDTRVNQLVLAAYLNSLPLALTFTGDGAQALEKLKQQEFDLILMDCQMPVMDGYEATRRLRAGEAGEVAARLPIIALTAHASASDRSKCLAAGMSDYLSKPFSREALLEMMEKWLPARAGNRGGSTNPR